MSGRSLGLLEIQTQRLEALVSFSMDDNTSML
jgi:hypothetical protein